MKRFVRLEMESSESKQTESTQLPTSELKIVRSSEDGKSNNTTKSSIYNPGSTGFDPGRNGLQKYAASTPEVLVLSLYVNTSKLLSQAKAGGLNLSGLQLALLDSVRLSLENLLSSITADGTKTLPEPSRPEQTASEFISLRNVKLAKPE
jgi:hypothetical protein